MCEFFSSLLIRDGRLLFTESNHHALIIARAHFRDDELFMRPFVRLECPPPHERFRVDEQGTLPAWFETQYGDGVALDELGQRVRSLSETVARLLKNRRNACKLARTWEAETRANLDKEMEHSWFQFDKARQDKLMTLSRRVIQMVSAANGDYERALRGLDGYVPPTPGEMFDADSDLTAAYNLWGSPPSPISLGSLPQATISQSIPYTAWKKSKLMP